MAESVKVIVRCRPMNNRETTLKCKTCVEIDASRCSCSIVNPNDVLAPPKTFTFDGVYGVDSTTEQIYNESAYPLVESVLEGYNSTVFAYGQTGCGKSFTMQGLEEPTCHRGVIPRAFEHIFEAISLAQDVKYLVMASYLEIYNEEIRDLLAPPSTTNAKDASVSRRLELKESPEQGIYVQDLSWHCASSVADCESLMKNGWSQRRVGATLMNADSSRSHSIFQVCLEMMDFSAGKESEPTVRKGKLSLVDLAGSERQAKTGAQGERLKEASKINLSLSALGNVISALVDGKAKHIPYRDSKLTRLLQDSLGGNTKTLMVACLSPADNNYDETLSTLRYANRAKNICNRPQINEDPKDALLRKYQLEIEALKQMLASAKQPQLPLKMSTIVDEVLLQEERSKVKSVYEAEIAALKKQYEAVRTSNSQMQNEFDRLKQKYDTQISEINKKSALKNQDHITFLEQRASSNEEGDNTVQASAPVNQPSSGPTNGTKKLSQQEILARLAKLQRSLVVGGERAGDQGLREKRAKRQRAAEKRLATLAEALAQGDQHDGGSTSSIVLEVYDDIHDRLAARCETLKRYKLKMKSLEREITDLQSEFESERTDYLETIRRLERQTSLYSQILEKILPALKNQYNYCNLDAIKSEAKWDEDKCKWMLPELLPLRTKLPPAGGTSWRLPSQTAPGRLQKSDRSDDEDFTGNYFKPKRATELLMKAQQDLARTNNNSVYPRNAKGGGGLLSSSLNVGLSSSLKSLPHHQQGINSVITTNNNNIYNKQSAFLNNSWSGPTQPYNSFWTDTSTARRPLKLEALPGTVAVGGSLNQKPNTMDTL